MENSNLFFRILFAITGYDCGGMNVLLIIKFIMGLLSVVMFIVPMGLIVMASVDLVQCVIAGSDGDMKKKRNLIIKRFVYAVFLFLVPTIVKTGFSLLSNYGIDYAGCVEIATTHDLSQYKIEFKDEGYKVPETNFKDPSDGYIVPEQPEKEEDSGNSGDNTSDDTSNYKNIFIGDSRFVGMKSAVGGDDNWIAKVGEGYQWFISSAISELDDIVEDGDNYNIIINLGVNDLGNIDKYLDKYEEMVTDSKYSNCNIVIVSVNPIEDSAVTGYLVRDSGVKEFNEKLKGELNDGLKYCDTYSKIKDDFDTTDGLHYKNSTYQKIYNEIKKCL